MQQSDKQTKSGCAPILVVLFSIIALLSLLLLGMTGPYVAHTFIMGAKEAEGVITGFEYADVQKRGPDGDYYTVAEPHAVVRFQTEDGTEREFTCEKKAEKTMKEGDRLSVCYNDRKAMIASQYRKTMRIARNEIIRLVIIAAGSVLTVVLLIIRGKRIKNKEKAAEQASGSE